MLRIKNNIDVKKLEKFGFKPKYNEDTGEICKYVFCNPIEIIAVYIELEHTGDICRNNGNKISI